MEDKELILRFISFYIRRYTEYNKTLPVDTWLSDTMIILNSMPNNNSREFLKSVKAGTILIDSISNISESDIEHAFVKAMIRAYQIFGNHAFRKSYGSNRRTPINKSLFETWSVILADLTETEFETLKNNKIKFMAEYAKILGDWQFVIDISRDSMKHLSVKSRFGQLNKLVANNIIKL